MTLTRRTPLRAQPRGKGNRGELAMRNLLRDFGWKDCRRNWQSGGQGGGDLINGPADVHNEVKWCEEVKIWAWLRQAEDEARPTDTPIIWHRTNATRWIGVLPDEDLDDLLEFARHCREPVRTYIVSHSSGRIRLWEWFAEAEQGALLARLDVPVVRFKRNESRWYSAAPAETILSLLRLREST